MTPQARAIVKELKYQYNYASLERLSRNLGIPEPSIRRCLHEINEEFYTYQSDYNVQTQNGVVRLCRG